MVPLSSVQKELSPQPRLDTEQSSGLSHLFCALSSGSSGWPCSQGENSQTLSMADYQGVVFEHLL